MDLSESDDPLIRDYLGLGRKISETEMRKRSDVQYVKSEDKEQDGHEQRRSDYAEHAKNYNKSKNQQDAPSQVAGVAVVMAIAVVAGIALFRSSGGPVARR